jgi:asparagine synthase (glutamine-hydrolysing)
MCGIVGVIGAESLTDTQIQRIRSANDAMFHRGPDGSGELLSARYEQGAAPRLCMAMRRLSIIDLEHGWQPLYNEDRSIALIANGEIYNHVEIRTELERRGRHTFQTASDCEVIIHLYEEYGLECVQKLCGMFSFALWDSKRRRLLLARDRMGEKPLYLHIQHQQIYFASELKSLVSMGVGSFDLDPTSIKYFLHYGWVPEPRTALVGISKLPPGCLLTIDLEPWRVDEVRYWNIESAPPVQADPAVAIRQELEQIVERIVRADVPVGIALSGGVDSSIVASMAAPGRSISAFTAGYKQKSNSDERQYARTLAAKLKMPFHEIEIDEADMVNDFQRLNFMRDDPICDIAGHGYYVVSKHARAFGCKVLLQGQGADELFWGYPWTLDACHVSRLRQKGANSISSAIYSVMGRSPATKAGFGKLARYLAASMLGWRSITSIKGRPDSLTLFDLQESYDRSRIAAKSVLSSEWVGEDILDVATRDVYAQLTESGVDVSMIAGMCKSSLLHHGLTQGDRLSMANSVELRLPFVDFRLVELVVGLLKSRGAPLNRPKQWLLEATRDLIPPEVARRPKTGFTPPTARWVELIRERYAPHLLDGYLMQHGIIVKKAATAAQKRHPRLSHWNETGFRMIVLEEWCRSMSAVYASASGSSHG